MESITPELPVVHLPFADRLPQPAAVVENTYDLAEKLLADQRKFAEGLLKAAKPLVPAILPANPSPGRHHSVTMRVHN
ncbi:MAG TPA: hypothetical protein DHU96_31010 [Actinobacteria bacterium]|nr:hypothetical protein [Actinomycetota bacterium]